MVMASNYPLAFFAEQIGGNQFEIRAPFPPDGDPAFWKPSVEAITAMQQADLLLLNGASYESWLKTSSLPSAILVDTSAGFEEQHIKVRTTSHSHGADGAHEHAATAFTTWLDIDLAIQQAQAVQNALIRLRPDKEVLFSSNFTAVSSELQQLDSDIRRIIGNSTMPVVYSHPVYQYFQRSYKINGKSVHWEPEQPLTKAMLEEFQELLSEHPAQWMIWEGEPLPESVLVLEALGVRSIVISPCGNVPEEGDYFSVMQQNVNALKQAYQTKP